MLTGLHFLPCHAAQHGSENMGPNAGGGKRNKVDASKVASARGRFSSNAFPGNKKVPRVFERHAGVPDSSAVFVLSDVPLPSRERGSSGKPLDSAVVTDSELVPTNVNKHVDHFLD